MDYKFMVIRRVHITFWYVLIQNMGVRGLGTTIKKSSRRSSLVVCFVGPIYVHFYWAYSPQLMNPMKVNLKYMR